MTLMEVMLTVALVAILLGLSLPALTTHRDAAEILGAARYLASEIARARAVALRRGTAVGLRFVPGADGYRVQVHVDGNDNGLRRSDIALGVDEPLGEEFRIGDQFPGVRLSRDAEVPPITGTGTRAAAGGPVRLGGSDTLTMSPLGTATSGTIYLRSRSGRHAAVRVLGATGRVRVMTFDAGGGGWR